MNLFMTFMALQRAAEKTRHMKVWDTTLESAEQMNDVLREIFISTAVEILTKVDSMPREALVNHTAVQLGLYDPGQPAFGLVDVREAIGKAIESGRLVEGKRPDAFAPTLTYDVVELPLLDKLAAEG